MTAIALDKNTVFDVILTLKISKQVNVKKFSWTLTTTVHL